MRHDVIINAEALDLGARGTDDLVLGPHRARKVLLVVGPRCVWP
jgi:hypothetical protein